MEYVTVENSDTYVRMCEYLNPSISHFETIDFLTQIIYRGLVLVQNLYAYVYLNKSVGG